MWIRLFILHFKKTVLFASVIIAVTEAMNYLYVDDTREFARCMMREFYEGKENIDRLYLGSSHVFCDIDPAILDEINGENNFNLASNTQQLNTSYYLLREAYKKNHIERVYLDLYYLCTNAGPGNFHDYQSLPPSWTVLNQMRPSANKLSYMLDLSSPKYYYMTFLPFMRYREQLFNLDYVAEIVEGKQSDEWKNYAYSYTGPNGEDIIKRGGKGFRIYYGELEYGGFCAKGEEAAITEDPITQESLEYLQKIVEFCEERDIQLIWIGCPISDFQLVRNGGYDNYIRQVSELAKQHQVSYYDFNLCKREYLDVSQEQYWFDMGHMNAYGAEAFSQFLGNFLLAQEAGGNEYRDCFYSSYGEKVYNLQQEIYGLEIVRSKEYERCMPQLPEEEWQDYVIYRLRFVTNAPEDIMDIGVSVVKDTVTGEREEVAVIREGIDAYVTFPVQEHGEMYVEARMRGAAEGNSWIGIEY